MTRWRRSPAEGHPSARLSGLSLIHIFYLPLAERKALREGRTDWLAQLVGYSKFFLIVTGVFGTISGVGIWFAIGLTNPEATSTLIHNFVFGWAIEWVFFMVELTTAAVYYYTWNRIDARLHLTVGWVYAEMCIRDSTCSLLHFFTRSLESFNELSVLGHSLSRLRLGDRHHRHLPRHCLLYTSRCV